MQNSPTMTDHPVLELGMLSCPAWILPVLCSLLFLHHKVTPVEQRIRPITTKHLTSFISISIHLAHCGRLLWLLAMKAPLSSHLRTIALLEILALVACDIPRLRHFELAGPAFLAAAWICHVLEKRFVHVGWAYRSAIAAALSLPAACSSSLGNTPGSRGSAYLSLLVAIDASLPGLGCWRTAVVALAPLASILAISKVSKGMRRSLKMDRESLARLRNILGQIGVYLQFFETLAAGYIICSFLFSCFPWRRLFAPPTKVILLSTPPRWDQFSFTGGFLFVPIRYIDHFLYKFWRRAHVWDGNDVLQRQRIRCAEVVGITSTVYSGFWLICEITELI